MTQLHHTHHTHHTGSGGRGHSHRPPRRETIKRGILTGFNPATYTANVLLMEATSTYIQGVPVACHMDGTSAQINAWCAVLFFDEQNYTDAVVLAIYPNGAQGIPVPAPGRVVFVAGFQQVNSAVINSGATNTYTLSGSGTGIPAGALGVIYKAYFTSATANTFINLAPHGANIGNYATIGNLPAANASVNGTGILQIDSNGQIDVKANGGTCTFNLFTHGYVI